MAINSFTPQIQAARFNPLSFQEMSFAPLALRERHDALLNQQDELLNTLNNVEVPGVFQEEFLAERGRLSSQIEEMASNINQQGAGNLETLSNFRNLRNDFNKSVSLTGPIGRLNKINADRAIKKENYFKIAFENGQSADDINRNWQNEVNKYQGQFEGKSLADFKGQLPEFLPDYAPKNLELSDHFIKHAGLLGSLKEKYDNLSFKPQYDPNGQFTGFSVLSNGTEIQSNDTQLESLKNLMTRDLFDPSSLLNKNLDFKNINPEDYLANIEDLAGISRKKSVAKTQRLAGTVGAPARGRVGSGKVKGNNVGLTPQSRGKSRREGSHSRTILLEDKKELTMARQAGSINTEDYAKEVNQINYALQKNKELLADANFSGQLGTKIADDKVLDGLGIKTQAQFEAFVDPNNTENHKNIEPTDRVWSLMGSTKPIPGMKTTKADIAEAAYGKAFEDTSRELLAGSTFYAINTQDKAGRDIVKGMNEGFNLFNTNLLDAISRGAGNISTDHVNFENISETGNEDLFNNFRNAINSGNTKYKVQGIEDGGAFNDAAILLNVNTGTGDDTQNFNITIDLSDRTQALSDDILGGDFYEAADPQTKIVLDNISAKIRNSTLPLSLPEDAFNENNSEIIKRHATRATLNPKYSFVKNDDSEYRAQVNDDLSYTMFKDGEAQTFKDLFSKTAYEEYIDQDGARQDYESDDNYRKDGIASFARTMLKVSENGEIGPGTSLYSTSQKYRDALKVFYNNINSTSDTGAQTNAALAFYEAIKDESVNTRNIEQMY